MKKTSLRAAASLLALSALFLAPACATAETNASQDADTYRMLKLFGDVFEQVRADYVEEVSDQELMEAAINGMLTSLDPHSSYLDREQFQDMRVSTSGEFGGLGIEITMEDGLVRVVAPIDETPAARAGVQANDFIVQIGNEPVMGLTLQDAVELMRGPVGSDVTITVQRGEEDPFELTLTRAIVKVQSVRARLEDNVGYIRIASFNEQTQTGLEKAVADLNAEAEGEIVGYVLDLRNNPGGLLDKAVSVSDSFLEQGEIVSTGSERRPELTERYNARAGDLIGGKPLVVLINGGSASASEIVAGALQDHRRAIVMGTKSFGKGSVQSIIPLPGGSAMRLTTARYFTPSGRSIQALGITPDIEVHQARVEELDDTPRRTEGALRGALSNPDLPNGAPAEENENAVPGPESRGPSGPGAPGEPSASADEAATGEQAEAQDYQLARAVDLLRGLSLLQAQRAAN